MTEVAVTALANVVTTLAQTRCPLAFHAHHVPIAHVSDHYIDVALVLHGGWWGIVLCRWLSAIRKFVKRMALNRSELDLVPCLKGFV